MSRSLLFRQKNRRTEESYDKKFVSFALLSKKKEKSGAFFLAGLVGGAKDGRRSGCLNW